MVAQFLCFPCQLSKMKIMDFEERILLVMFWITFLCCLFVGASERKCRRNNCAHAAAKRRRSSQFDTENRVPTDDQNDSDEEEFVDKHVSDICQVKLNTEKESAKLCGYSTPRWGTITNGNPSSNGKGEVQRIL